MICYRCKATVNENEKWCGQCGYQLKRSHAALYIVASCVVVVLGIGGWLYRSPAFRANLSQDAPRLSALTCSTSDIEITSVKAQYENACRTRECMFLKGIAVLKNKCTVPIGVQIKITGLDAAGQPVATRELWPASTRNIPPGEYDFSLDQWLDYDPAIRSFRLTPVRVRQWSE